MAKQISEKSHFDLGSEFYDRVPKSVTVNSAEFASFNRFGLRNS